MKKVYVYCSGPLQGCTEQEATGWREEFKLLVPETFEVVDPADCWLRDYKGMTARERKQLVDRDIGDVLNSDAVIFNAWRSSFGSPMEIVYAHLNRVPVVTVFPHVDLSQVSPWLSYHSDKIVCTLGEAVNWLVEWFGESKEGGR